MIKYLFSLFFFLIFTNFSYAQITIVVSGKVSNSSGPIVGAILELKSNGFNKKAISQIDGSYNFLINKETSQDSLTIKVSYIGYQTIIQRLKKITRDTTIKFVFFENVENLKEVTIKRSSAVHSNAYKSVYKINPSVFSKNTKVDAILSTIPNISMQNGDILLDGRFKTIIFIDGIESDVKELRTLTAEDIERFEVIANPSASYNTDFTGSVINVILKRKIEDYFKAILEVSGGIRNKAYSSFPSIAYKRKGMQFKSYYSYLHNRQKIYGEINRHFDDGSYYNQNSLREPKGYQEVLNSKFSLALTKKLKLNISNEIAGYKFVANTKGAFVTKEFDAVSQFTNENSIEKQRRYHLSSVFEYVKNNKNSFFLKGKYFRYNNINTYDIKPEASSNTIGSVESNTRESTVEVEHNLEKLFFSSREISVHSGLKYIYRDFEFFSDQFNINQSSINLYSEFNTKISRRFSLMLGFSLENTQNSSAEFRQQYFYALPTLNLNLTLPNNYTIKVGYSRKIIRPSARDLNNQIVYANPGFAEQGNRQLKPQTRGYLFLSTIKNIQNTSLTVRIFRETINNSIVPIYTKSGNIVLSRLENASDNTSTGFNFNLNTRLFSILSTNLATGIDYNYISSDANQAITTVNHGWTNRSNFYISSSFLKKRLSVSLSGYYNSPLYSLSNTTRTNPNLNFNLDTNLFKDKLNISLTYSNMFALNNAYEQTSIDKSFFQNNITRNNTSNLILTLSLNLGKKFESNIANSTLENSDIRIR